MWCPLLYGAPLAAVAKRNGSLIDDSTRTA
jgi:hypothetical protein